MILQPKPEQGLILSGDQVIVEKGSRKKKDPEPLLRIFIKSLLSDYLIHSSPL